MRKWTGMCVRISSLLGISGAMAKNNLHQNTDVTSMSLWRKNSKSKERLSMHGCTSACVRALAVQECMSAWSVAVRWVCSPPLYSWSPASPQHWFKQAASEAWKLTDLEKGWKRKKKERTREERTEKDQIWRVISQNPLTALSQSL